MRSWILIRYARRTYDTKERDMREDYLETLDKMFPEGYIICYTNPDEQLRMALYNPNKYELIEDIHKQLKERE